MATTTNWKAHISVVDPGKLSALTAWEKTSPDAGNANVDRYAGRIAEAILVSTQQQSDLESTVRDAVNSTKAITDLY